MPVKTVAVVGLGKIGLPLAAHYASKGMKVVESLKNSKVAKAIGNGMGALGAFNNVKSLGGDLLTDAKDVRNLFRDPSSKNFQQLIKDAKSSVRDGKALADSIKEMGPKARAAPK